MTTTADAKSKKPFFAKRGPNTLWAFVLSVPLSCFLFITAFVVYETLSKRQITIDVLSNLLGNTIGIFFGSLIIGAFMLIPAFAIAYPLYLFLKARMGIQVWTCVGFGAIVSAFIPALFGLFGGNDFIFLFMFLVPGALAGFIFHRIDQGCWFRKREELDPTAVF